MKINSDYAAINADVEDAISEGVVIVAAAGNNNYHCVPDGDPDYSNTVTLLSGTYLYNRGASPGNSLNTICVGALGNRHDFRRSTYSNFGPLIDIFAPGNNILSAYNNSGLADSKYGGAPNYFYPIQGTSMASPQVAGVLACLATGKERFNQNDAKGYLNNTSVYNDMSWNASGGQFDDSSCQQGSPDKYLIAKNPREGVTGMIFSQVGARSDKNALRYPRVATFNRAAPAAMPKTFTISVTNIGGSHYVFNGSDRAADHVDAQDPVINVNVGDTLVFSFNISGSHPFWVKTSPTTGTGNGVTTGTITNNGQQSSNLTWDTNGVTAGTYYYICQIHSSMSNSIIVS